MQCGAQLRGYGISLKDYELRPYHRNAQLMEDLFGVHLSHGTLASMEPECARQLQPLMEPLRQAVRDGTRIVASVPLELGSSSPSSAQTAEVAASRKLFATILGSSRQLRRPVEESG